MTTKTCKKCGKSFETGRGTGKPTNSIFCSFLCNRKNKSHAIEGIPTGTVGAISELMVCADLLKKKYTVFRSVSQCAFCDLIIFRNSKAIKVEVKTNKFRTDKKTLFIPKVDRRVDIIAIYDTDTNEIFYTNNEGVLLNCI